MLSIEEFETPPGVDQFEWISIIAMVARGRRSRGVPLTDRELSALDLDFRYEQEKKRFCGRPRRPLLDF